MATARMTPAELARLRELADAIDRSDDVVGANRRFHRALNRSAAARRACSPTCARRSGSCRANYFELFPEQEQRSRREHAALLDAMASGDGPAARSLCGGPRAQGRRGPRRVAGGEADSGTTETRRTLSRGARRRSSLFGRSDLSSGSRLARSSGVVNDRSSALSAKSSEARTARSRWRLITRLVSSTARLGSRRCDGRTPRPGPAPRRRGQTWLTRPISAARGPGCGPGQRVLLRQLQAREQRPGDGPPSAATSPTSTCGSARVRALRHEDDVRERDQAAAEPDRRTVHGGDDRQPAPHHAGHDLPTVRRATCCAARRRWPARRGSRSHHRPRKPARRR